MPLAEAKMVELVRSMIGLLPATEGSRKTFSQISIRIIRDEEMSQLHKKYSNVDGTTDVLTFVQGNLDSGIEVDLALCADEAVRRSVEFGHSVENELALYAVHGLLHAIGFDDHDEEHARRMHAEEDRILTLLGIGAVYAHRGGGRS
ncbi:MAG: rRNA maturation RNase YbeY [Planctomycetota bacterium]|nr:rRNA maturation RNase YbeY [Planctomycetota bacterium]